MKTNVLTDKYPIRMPPTEEKKILKRHNKLYYQQLTGMKV